MFELSVNPQKMNRARTGISCHMTARPEQKPEQSAAKKTANAFEDLVAAVALIANPVGTALLPKGFVHHDHRQESRQNLEKKRERVSTEIAQNQLLNLSKGAKNFSTLSLPKSERSSQQVPRLASRAETEIA